MLIHSHCSIHMSDTEMFAFDLQQRNLKCSQTKLTPQQVSVEGIRAHFITMRKKKKSTRRLYFTRYSATMPCCLKKCYLKNECTQLPTDMHYGKYHKPSIVSYQKYTIMIRLVYCFLHIQHFPFHFSSDLFSANCFAKITGYALAIN